MSTAAWSGAEPAEVADPGSYELGTTFDAAVPVLVAGVRVRAGANPGVVAGRLGRLWSATGTLLASVAMAESLSTTAWSEFLFDAPIAMGVGDRFLVSYTTGGNYCTIDNAFNTAVATADGALTFVAGSAAAHGNGSFTTSPTTFPDHASNQNTFYGIDVLYDLPATTAPTIDRVTTTVGAGAVATSTITASGDLTDVTYRWDWGDGHSSTAGTNTAQHPYIVSGTFSILVSAETTGGQAFAASTARVLVAADSEIQTLVAAIKDALSTITGLTVYTETDASPNPPAVYIGPPQLTWTVYNRARPDQMSFPLYLVVASDGYAVAALEPLLDAISDALASMTDAVLTQAVPSSWPAGGANLPAYLLTLEAGT